MISYTSYYIAALATVLIFAAGYWFLRGIIWSIAKCNINKKTCRSVEFKSQKNISMSYLSAYITRFHRQYCFWMKVKRLYVIFQITWLFVYLLLPLSNCNLIWPFVFNLGQSYILFALIGVQYDTNRNTKYDRFRQNKH